MAENTTDETLELYERAEHEMDILAVTLTAISKHPDLDCTKPRERLRELQDIL